MYVPNNFYPFSVNRFFHTEIHFVYCVMIPTLYKMNEVIGFEFFEGKKDKKRLVLIGSGVDVYTHIRAFSN